MNMKYVNYRFKMCNRSRQIFFKSMGENKYLTQKKLGIRWHLEN